jgi:hypothetical protein
LDLAKFKAGMENLLDSLCAHRAYGPLRTLLPNYPMPNGFGDEWVKLANALKTVRAQHRDALTPGELELVISLQHATESAVGSRVPR